MVSHGHTNAAALQRRDANTQLHAEDEYLFGWNPTPGIVSVWAHRDGHALVWRREGDQVYCNTEHYRPWVLATSLDDVDYLGAALQPDDRRVAGRVTVRYRQLIGPNPSYRYLLFARDQRTLERAILEGAGSRLKRPVRSFKDLQDAYYRVGPVEQFMMSTGKVYFRGINYEDLHRLQFDLETTALDPHRGRIFMVSIRDSRGLATILEAATPEDEAALIRSLCDLIRERDPDVIENHNLFGFDLPFLEHRSLVVQRK